MEPSLYVPTPGSAAPGNLYADLQTRTLWLGVDPAVDANQAVLISDILSLQNQITASTNTAKAYTDSQITTRAPTVHTHTSAQITDFNAAVTTVATNIPSLSYTKGMIMAYYGSLADVGVGPLAGWALCDGSNGTPNLRDRFIIGAGNKPAGFPAATPPAGSVGANAGVGTDSQGSHVHTVNGTAITEAQMPSHNHNGVTGFVSADHSHAINLNTGTESADHSHPHTDGAGPHVGGSGSGVYAPGGAGPNTGGRSAAHYHNVAGQTGGISANHTHSIPIAGSDATHTHTLVANGAHVHAITSAALREAVPYYALAYIMKL